MASVVLFLGAAAGVASAALVLAGLIVTGSRPRVGIGHGTRKSARISRAVGSLEDPLDPLRMHSVGGGALETIEVSVVTRGRGGATVTRLGLEIRNLQRQWLDLPDLPFVGPSRPVRLEGRDECSWYLPRWRLGASGVEWTRVRAYAVVGGRRRRSRRPGVVCVHLVCRPGLVPQPGKL